MTYRRIFISRLFCLLLLAQRFLVAQPVERVDAVGITVSDMDKALAFYTKVLPFERISEQEFYGSEYERLKGLFGIRFRKARLRLGDEEIELTDYLTVGGRPIPVESRSNDLWFQHIAIVVRDMDSAYARLRQFNVEHISTAPQTLPPSIPAAAGIRAFYFRDMDGHALELIYFPPDKGNPKWQRPTDKIFLGIDHTAIGISSTQKSAAFYQQLLGMSKLGESFNFGTEQEHLNNVFGASLHITGNGTASGFGVEFLEYLAPRGARPYPADARADDLIHWETIFVVKNIEALFKTLNASGVTLLSASVVTVPSRAFGYKKAFYARDPDGHVVGFFEK